jgi:hypothetical protein
MKQRALIAVQKEIQSISTNSVSRNELLTGEEEPEFNTKYGIELPASIWIVRVEAVEN